MRHYNIYSINIVENISRVEERYIALALMTIIDSTILTPFNIESYANSTFPLSALIAKLDESGIEWDNWIEDMSRLAQSNPAYTFIVDGDDGEDGKMWRTYFRGDKIFTADARVVYDIPEWYEED